MTAAPRVRLDRPQSEFLTTRVVARGPARKVLVRMPDAMHQALKEAAAANNVSTTLEIVRRLAESLKRERRP